MCVPSGQRSVPAARGLQEGKVGKAGRQSEKAEPLQHSREWEATGKGRGRYRGQGSNSCAVN